MVVGAEGSKCSRLEMFEKEKKKGGIVCRITDAASLCRVVPSSAVVFAAQPGGAVVGRKEYKKNSF